MDPRWRNTIISGFIFSLLITGSIDSHFKGYGEDICNRMFIVNERKSEKNTCLRLVESKHEKGEQWFVFFALWYLGLVGSNILLEWLDYKESGKNKF